jgi:hypothetical protein
MEAIYSLFFMSHGSIVGQTLWYDLCNGKTTLMCCIRSCRIYELAMEGTELAKYLIDMVEMQKVKLTRDWSSFKVSENLS